MPESKIAFNTANLVGRVTGYRFTMHQWMDQHVKTVAQTDEAAWREICREIAAAGFRAVEIWAAHIDPATMTREKARTRQAALNEFGLVPIGAGAGFNEATVRVCEWLNIPAINGGMWDALPLPEIEKLARRSGVRFNMENHPEKSAAEVLQGIDGGSDMIGVAVDTGWFGTQGANAAAEVKVLGSLVRHVHVKDVEAVGTHRTCPLGTGVVGVDRVIEQLQSAGYAGWYSWEDEPEERNPMLIAQASREWLQRQLGG